MCYTLENICDLRFLMEWGLYYDLGKDMGQVLSFDLGKGKDYGFLMILVYGLGFLYDIGFLSCNELGFKYDDSVKVLKDPNKR